MLNLPMAVARQLMLAKLGLLNLPTKIATKAAVLAAINQMHLLQIDTISVVARSHYFVLWSRLGDYQLEWLDELLAEKQVFEYWSHAACFLPVADYGIYRRQMFGKSRSRTRLENYKGEAENLLAFIRANGAVRTADFERQAKTKGQGWWDWKPEKIILESLFTTGDLMISKRQSFQRFYDLPERVLPEWDDNATPSEAEAEIIFARKAVQALGVAQAKWIANYFYRPKKENLQALKHLVAGGEVQAVAVEGWSEPAYIHANDLALLEEGLAGQLEPNRTTFLSPFDPLISDRERVRIMFSFDYNIECYTPAAKRRYGYFTLPVLHRGQLIGRVDAKAHRKNGIFEVIKLHLEPGVRIDEVLIRDVREALERCAAWHKTPQVVVRWTDPPELAGLLV
jgi:uncharacterized protein